MSTAVCELSDLPVNQCSCRLHAAPEHRGGAPGQGGSRDGYPTAGAAARLADPHIATSADSEFPRALARIQAAGGAAAAVHEFAGYCAWVGHVWENFRATRAGLVAAAALATAEVAGMQSVELLALVEDAGPVPWELPMRSDWVADVDAIFARRAGSRQA